MVAVSEVVSIIRAGDEDRAAAAIAASPAALQGVADGGTPAHWCAVAGSVRLLQLIERHGGPLDAAVEPSGMTPLHWAAYAGQLAVVKHLVVAAGICIDSADTRRTTPLMIAVQRARGQLLYWLLRKGADPSLLDVDGDSALHWAAYAGDVTALALLPAGAGGLAAVAPDAHGSTLLHLAAGRGCTAAVRWLMRQPGTRPMLEAVDSRGRTPLALATERTHDATRQALEAIASQQEEAEGGLAAWAWRASAGATHWWHGTLHALDERFAPADATSAEAAAPAAAAGPGSAPRAEMMEMVPVAEIVPPAE